MKKIYYLFVIIPCLFISKIEAQNYQKGHYGFKASVGSLDIRIEFYSPEIVRVLKSPIGISYDKKSLSIIKNPEKCDLQVSKGENNLSISSDKLKVDLSLVSGKVQFSDMENNLLLTEVENGTKFIPKKDLDENTFAVKQTFKLDPDEFIYGLGQFQNGKMSRRNQRLYLMQTILETAIPFFQSIKGYGLFWDNYSRTTFLDTLNETSFDSEIGDCSDYYFMLGGNADGVIGQMRDLTGQVPMFPYWTYGYWQSRERYKSQDETIGVVKKYRELGVPFDGIIQDWQYWGDNLHWNSMEFGNPMFPDPKGMINQIHDMNAHIIISIWSSFGPETKQYHIMKEKDMLFDFKTWPLYAESTWPPKPDAKFSGVKVYDAYNPEARNIYWNYLRKGIFSLGMDGWWMDSTEPDHFDIKDEDYNNKTYFGSFRKVRNAFPIMTVGGVYDHQRSVTSDKRVFILTRSAFAGQQRYGANSWSGDVVSDWLNLRNQISAGLNFSLCGIPFWNSDIGGFFTHVNYPKGKDDLTYQELYVRWLQFGAFCPMMRSHGTDTPREIYQFGEKGDWAFDAIEKFINLRYRLLPYIYSTSWDVTSNASSMMRALMMDFANDKNALDINDQYMFGKSILVCPVTKPLYTTRTSMGSLGDFSEIKTSQSYLPAGIVWYDFWNGEKFEGGQEIERPTPVDIMPLYIKAGSIVPMGPLVHYANEKIDPAEIRVYPGEDGKFILYEDERDNYNYEKGMYATVEFKWEDKKKTLTIGELKGSFPGMVKKRRFNIVFVGKNHGCGEKTTKKIDQTIHYDGKQQIVNQK